MNETLACVDVYYEDDNNSNLTELLVRHNNLSDRRRKRRKSDIRHKNRERKLYEIHKGHIISPMSEKSNKSGKSYYQHIYYNNKYGKRCANRKVRRSDVIMNGGDYKKFYDYKWEIF